jgi:predicted phage-related endonuclease
MNDRDDFLPEVRNGAWWSGDSRQVMNGNAVQTVLIKQGKLPPLDFTGIEAVEMGLVMQPTIARIASDRLKMELKEADYAMSHSKEDWLRSHFDYINTAGDTLVEVKNYNAMVRNKFDAETNRVPAADYIQCLHEATVHNVDRVILAVLFGGQEFVTFDFTFTQDQKLDFIKQMSVFWAHVVSGTVPPAKSVDDTKLAYPQSVDGIVIANQAIETRVSDLKQLKAKIKELETLGDEWETEIRNALGDRSELRTFDGNTLVTWRSSKASMKFSADLFKTAMPDIYQKFVVEQMGSRRFLIK